MKKEPRTEVVTVRFRPSDMAELKESAERLGITVVALIRARAVMPKFNRG